MKGIQRALKLNSRHCSLSHTTPPMARFVPYWLCWLKSGDRKESTHESLYLFADLSLRKQHSSLCPTRPQSIPRAARAGETAAPRGLWRFLDLATHSAWAFPPTGVSTVSRTWRCNTTSAMPRSSQTPAAQVSQSWSYVTRVTLNQRCLTASCLNLS